MESEKPEGYVIIDPRHCDKCGKTYGKSNLEYRGIEIWISCDCQDPDKIYMINRNALKFLDEQPNDQ